MSIMLASRHVRAEEESGRLEVVRALPVGRFAPAAAALGAVAVADEAVGAGITAGLFALSAAGFVVVTIGMNCVFVVAILTGFVGS